MNERLAHGILARYLAENIEDFSADDPTTFLVYAVSRTEKREGPGLALAATLIDPTLDFSEVENVKDLGPQQLAGFLMRESLQEHTREAVYIAALITHAMPILDEEEVLDIMEKAGNLAEATKAVKAAIQEKKAEAVEA